MKHVLLFLSIFAFSSCQTKSAYFSPESELPGWGVQTYHAKALEEPALFNKRATNREQYRLIVFSGITPVHSIRLQVSEASRSRLTTARLSGGYRLAKRPNLKSRKTTSISKSRVEGFLAQLEKQKFMDLESLPIHGGEICIHPTIFQFESVKGDQYYEYLMSVCSLSIEGVTMVKTFYELAEITGEDEWSLTDYFSEAWKKPEYQNLLGED